MFQEETLHSVYALTITSNGETIYQYNSQGQEELRDTRSITKCITSLLIGIALKNRIIDSLDVPIRRYLEDAPADIIIEDLLRMKSGFYIEDSKLNERLRTSQNWVRDIFRIEKKYKVFLYKGVDYHLLSTVLSKATGMNASQFAEKFLFSKLGIREYEWPNDPQGISIGSTGLRLSHASLCKIATLISHTGMYGEEQLLPSWWFDGIEYQPTNLPFGKYGFGFWKKSYRSMDTIKALGTGGQQILVCPDSKLTMVMTTNPKTHSHEKTEIMTAYMLKDAKMVV